MIIKDIQNKIRSGQSFNTSLRDIKPSSSINKSMIPDDAIARTKAEPSWLTTIPSSTFAPGYRPTGSLYDRFMIDFQRSTPILANSRFIQMNAMQEEVQDLEFKATLYPGRKNVLGGTINAPLYKGTPTIDNGGIPDTVSYEIDKQFINAREAVCWTSIPEIFLIENLEGAQFESTLLNLMLDAVAYEIERVFLYANLCATVGDYNNNQDVAIYKNDKGILRQIRESGRQLSDFDLGSTQLSPIELFGRFLKEYKKPYANPISGGLPHLPKTTGTITYTDDIIMVALREQLAIRETNLGDSTIKETPDDTISIMGTTMYQSDSLTEPVRMYMGPAKTSPEVDNDKPKMLMTTPSNLVYGVFNDIRVRSAYDIMQMANIMNIMVIAGQLVMTPWKSAYADITVAP